MEELPFSAEQAIDTANSVDLHDSISTNEVFHFMLESQTAITINNDDIFQATRQ
jgi:hypothetical protein